MNQKARILFVDDDAFVLETLQDLFSESYQVVLAPSGLQALAILQKDTNFDAIILDIKMAKMDGLQTASKIKEIDPGIPIIFHTGYPGEYSEAEIEDDFSPFDYVCKGESPSRLQRAVRHAVSLHQLSRQSLDLSEHARLHFGMVGHSAAILDVYQTIEQIAPTNNKIIICGATGTGKELVARAIHRMSRRATHKLVICNCNHRPPDLVETELFGHLRGSFTGAVTDRVGLFEYADGGTLFLDEVGDLDVTTQGKILRVLETGEMSRIGGPETITVNVRLICATHRDLPEMVAKRQFREDLYYRLKGVTIALPALRERRDDIPELIDYFIENHCRHEGIAVKVFEPSARDLLVEYDWPGNVRQLMDTVQSLIDLSPSQFITRQEVSGYLGLGASRVDLPTSAFADQVREFKRKLVIKALDRNDQNVRAAARDLSVDPSNLRKIMKDLGVVRGKQSGSSRQS